MSSIHSQVPQIRFVGFVLSPVAQVTLQHGRNR